jgi:GNAT superfamily N-acetyltransferase
MADDGPEGRTGTVEVRPVGGRLDRRRFVDLPFRLFGGDPDWVPPLRLTVYDRISPKYPASAHQKTALWLAWQNGRPVGRIGACVDRLFNEFQDVSWAWVGFFEAVDDPRVASKLFETAWAWAAGHGVSTCVGPASFTTNDECGLLVKGFEHPPLILTPQTPSYYERLWAGGGWQPARDLYAWRFDSDHTELSDRHQRALDWLRHRSGLRARSMRMSDFEAEVGRFFKVYNAAWARNWGFAPMTEAEIQHVAKGLKRIIDPDLAIMVEKPSGEPVAVALALPDVNEILHGIRSGRLLPTGWWRLLRGAKRISRARVYALGVLPEHRGRAVGPLLYAEIVDRMRGKGIFRAEASWILDINHSMNSAVEAMGGKHYKTWRMYQHRL